MPVAQGSTEAALTNYSTVSAQPRTSSPKAGGTLSTDKRVAPGDRGYRDEPRSTRQQHEYGTRDRPVNTRASSGGDAGESRSLRSSPALDKGSGRYSNREAKGSSMHAAGSASTSYPPPTSSYPPKSDTATANADDAGTKDRTRSRGHAKPAISHISTEDDEDTVMVYHDADERDAHERELNEPPPSTPSRSSGAVVSYTTATAGPPGVHQVPPQPFPHEVRYPGTSSASVQVTQDPPPPPPLETRPGADYGQHGGQFVPDATKDAPAQARTGGVGGYLSRINIFSGPSTGDKTPFDRLTVELQQAQEELKRSRSEIRTLNRTCQELYNDKQRYHEQLVTLKTELKNVTKELDDSRQLSEVRGKELLGAQVFLTKADLLSVSEVIQKVNDLNDESFQAAALLAESLVRHEAQWTSEEEKETSYRIARPIIGEHMLKTLVKTTNESSPNPFLVQLVLQICMAGFCRQKISKWYEGDEGTNKFLNNIYTDIRRTEEQAVSGRWRAITHAKTRLSADGWTHEFMQGLSHVLALACWGFAYPAEAAIILEQKFKPIARAILDLRIALGEHFTSSDLEPFLVEPETPFDPRRMEDALGDDRAGRGRQDSAEMPAGAVDIVAATSGLGLLQWVPRGTRRGSGEYQITLLPKVILQSTLNELLQPPPPRKSKSGRGKEGRA